MERTKLLSRPLGSVYGGPDYCRFRLNALNRWLADSRDRLLFPAASSDLGEQNYTPQT